MCCYIFLVVQQKATDSREPLQSEAKVADREMLKTIRNVNHLAGRASEAAELLIRLFHTKLSFFFFALWSDAC